MPALELAARLLAQGALMALGLWTLRSRTDILILAAFVVLSLLGTFVFNTNTVFVWFDGLRQYVGFLFVPPIIRYLLADKQFRGWFVERLDRNLYRFLWLQVPCILIQFFRYNDFDQVGGSLGYNMSGIISNMIYLFSFYLMLRRWDPVKKYMQNIKDNFVLIFLLFPSLLNETKVSFVFVLMYFFFLIPMDRYFVKRVVMLSPVVILTFVGAVYAYNKAIGGNMLISDSKSAVEYLVGDPGSLIMVENVLENNEEFMKNDMARFLKLIITVPIMDRNPPSWFVGYGIGQYKVGGKADDVPFAKQYWWLLIGTIMQGHMIWIELGLIGVALYFIYWGVLLGIGRKLPGRNKQLQWFLGLNILLSTLYSCPMIIAPYAMTFIALILMSRVWDTLPPYKKSKLMGSREINWSLKTDEQKG
ncbi:MAG: hypothetical protein NC548_47740 [Lachnospiraceae bacterium]|nr:hypothetical protein [Lachnospiraceae bacterium]